MTPGGVLDRLLDDPAATGVFSDFDGTLSPIVDDPAAARPLPGAADALAALAGRVGVVGVISGRPASFLLDQLGGGSGALRLWGLHGLETVDGGVVVGVPDAEPWRPVVGQVTERGRRELGAGVEVEGKGLSLTLHFRRHPDQGAAVGRWCERVAGETGLVVHPARMSYELRPPVPHGKGVVLERAVEARALRAACFFGDDAGDVDAFAALERLAARGVATVRVAVRSAEAPPALLDRADAVLDGPEGVVEALRALAQV